MRTGYFRNFNGTLNHLIPLYKQTDNLLKSEFIVTWNDLVQPEKELVELAKEFNKPSFVVEHGMKAVSDYEKGLEDTYNKMGGKPFIADHMMVWGQKSKDIMIEAGTPEDKITVVGSPIIKDFSYRYSSNKGEIKEVPFNAGPLVVDPENDMEWELLDCGISIPRNEKDSKGQLIVFMPFHDWKEEGVIKTQKIWDKIKHMPNVFVAASSAYQNKDPLNPFLDLLKEEDYRKRIQKIMCTDIRKPTNISFVKNLLKKASIVITAIPGTVNGIAWAMDTPILTPNMDWNWVKDGKAVFDIWPADYTCEVDDIESKIESIIKKDTKGKERLEYAKYFMGIDAGNPIDNMRNCIENNL